jgi:hypothetical protein
VDSGFRPVALGGDDPLTNSDDELYFRRHPKVKRALRRAIRRAMNAAEHNQSIDPLELLAEGLAQLATPPPAVVTVPSVPTHYVKPANAWGPGPSPFKRHKLPAKLPTRGMWPPVSPVSPDDPNGAYRSLGKLKHYRGGDLEQPGELKKAVEARSHNGELILTYGNEVGTAWIANLVFSLRASGIEHYLVIVMSDAHCKALSRPPWMISCAWSSWDFTSCKNKGELRRLWYSRHHYMSRVIAETKLNVAVVDGDMCAQREAPPPPRPAALAALTPLTLHSAHSTRSAHSTYYACSLCSLYSPCSLDLLCLLTLLALLALPTGSSSATFTRSSRRRRCGSTTSSTR